MKKKIITIMLAAAMLVSMLASCQVTIGGGSDNDTSSAADTSDVSDVSDTSSEDVSGEDVSSTGSSPANTADIDISDDLFSGQISVEGHVYTLPCAFSEFEANGWKMEGEDGSIDPNYVAFRSMSKGDIKFLSISVCNLTSDTIHYTDCMVYNLRFSPYEGAEVILPGNFVFDENVTVDSIIAQYGEPTEKREMDEYTTLVYKKDIYKEISFQVYKPSSGLGGEYTGLRFEYM